jgi:hypothetical protein
VSSIPCSKTRFEEVVIHDANRGVIFQTTASVSEVPSILFLAYQLPWFLLLDLMLRSWAIDELIDPAQQSTAPTT